jgi:membrane-bound serine protease (ClpP class)
VLSILFSAGVFFMIMELFTAGFGLFGILSIVCFGLYFFGGVIAGYTEWWAVVLFALGAVFFIIEIIIPGFGIFGVLGIVLTLLGLMFSAKSLRDFVIQAGITLAICAVSVPIMFKLFGRLKVFDKIILKHGETNEEGYMAPSQQTIDALGKTGTTVTMLHPSGMAVIDGRRMDVLSHEGIIEVGVEVRVIDTSGNRVVVERVPKQ